MEDLKALFDARDKHHSEYTLKIFEQINITLGCVTAYLTDIDEGIGQGIITWEDVNFMEDMLVVLGTVNYNIGDHVELFGENFIITEDNADDLQQIVHMSVPLDLVNGEDEDKIMEYLYNAGENKPIENFSEIITTPARAVLDEDFDLSELSEEQLQALKFATAKGGQ